MHVFVDESERHGTYLLCAATFHSDDLHKARTVIRGLAKPGQRRVHMVKEQDSRRREILNIITTSRARARIYLCHGSAIAAREACLWQLLGDLTITPGHVQALVLEAMDGQDHRDRATIRRARAVMPPRSPP